ncbi:MAG: (d)CMP kinase [Planctomycetota bacterium]|jgi:cytidylate kinase
MSNLVITIDGPAASGKSTVANLLAKRIGAIFLDTGAMYRAVTFAAMAAGIDLNDEDQILAVLNERKFKFEDHDGIMRTYVDELDVTEQIREPDVTAKARHIASAAAIRLKLVGMQRKYAAHRKKVVTEGRDQGTVAFPKADIKFYLTAEVRVRAQRRHIELTAKGRNESLQDVQNAIQSRDKSDQNREIGPLKPADDAIVIDTTKLNLEQVVDKLFQFVKEICLKKD